MRSSFLAGAAILMAANIISKALGAVLKIPLTYIMHEEGMAVYNTAFGVYIMFLSFFISGMPFAVQKLTAAAHARGSDGDAKEIVFVATVVLTAAGMIGTLVMWRFSEFFALAMKEPRAGLALRAIAPAVLFVALGTSVKSGFQGRSDMLPTATSQVIEAIIKLFAGYLLAVFLISRGAEYAAAGAAGGVTVGETAATFILALWYIVSYRRIKRSRKGFGKVLVELGSVALPLLFISIVVSGFSMCETSVLRASLLRAGLSEEKARFVYGAYTGYAMTLLNLPAGFLATLGISIIPVISGAAELKDMKKIRTAAWRGIGLCTVSGIIAAVSIAVFGELMLLIIFHNTYSAPMLRFAAPSVMFICVMQMSCAILQSLGYIWRSFIASVSAACIKLICSAILASVPVLNIYGAIIGSDIAFFVGMVVSLLFVAGCVNSKKLNYL
ncbi:MAG: oligosaccharide flippase family protein [Clostridia bacterium]|nr:oligosaccharide flippase family protein [Clostridia bacterium]